MVSPSIDINASGIIDLIHQIHGVNRKPAIGEPPPLTRLPKTEYSAAATAVAEIYARHTTNAETGDQYSLVELAERTELSTDDLKDALHELKPFFLEIRAAETYIAKASLYARFDRYFMDFDPAEDALKLAADLINDVTFPANPQEIADRYGWKPRRLNPAITYLSDRNVIHAPKALSTGPYVTFRVGRKEETRRFVKSRS